MQMDTEAAPTGSLVQRPTGVPRPRTFPILDNAPGPRCGHTLTTISGPEGDVNRAKLVLFGARCSLAKALHALDRLGARPLLACKTC
jgi:hypothetical protein